uniref:Cro/Cl family transcriptional regulator n=1 Tax=uncultured Alphaproteobacteria bacterium TaxID=91750 RepID=A0A1B0Z265_9PROT|nr:Cro/Cl family transcriptional regulator [uncultured Alphaproteobacteria bacterium]
MAYTKYRIDKVGARKKRIEAGEYIKSLRLAHDPKITQRALADKLKLTYYTFVSQVETGAARVPPEAQVAWAKALEVDPKEFATRLLSYYDPHTHRAIFGKG